jgi:hypothetical protein
MIRSRLLNAAIALGGAAVGVWALGLTAIVLIEGRLHGRGAETVALLAMAAAAGWATLGALANLRHGDAPVGKPLPTQRWAGLLLVLLAGFGAAALTAEDLASVAAAAPWFLAFRLALAALPVLLLVHLGLRLAQRRRG